MKEIPLIAAAALLLASCERSAPLPVPIPSQELSARVLSVSCNSVSGWIRPLSEASIAVYSDGYFLDPGYFINGALFDTSTDDQIPFDISMDNFPRDGETHKIRAIRSANGTKEDLLAENQTLNCPAPI